jgi:endoglucanase
MYCILSILFDGKFWQSKYSKDKYINFWFQIANEFTDFDEYLIFESKNEVDYEFIYDYNYKEDENNYGTYDSYYQNLFNSTQDFIYIIRNSGNFNSKRLLVIPEYSTDVEICYFSFFFELDIPIDPSNKLAVSINLILINII